MRHPTYVFNSQSLSLSLSLFFSFSPSIHLSVPRSLSHSLSLSVSLSLSLSLSPFHHAFHTLSLIFFVRFPCIFPPISLLALSWWDAKQNRNRHLLMLQKLSKHGMLFVNLMLWIEKLPKKKNCFYFKCQIN